MGEHWQRCQGKCVGVDSTDEIEVTAADRRRLWFWRLAGRGAPMGLFIMPGWPDHQMFYPYSCPKHGEYVTYPQGQDGHVFCPGCSREAATRPAANSDPS